jgi:hypothetical protein
MLNSGITWSGWDTNFLAGDGREAHREPRVLAQLGVEAGNRPGATAGSGERLGQLGEERLRRITA